VVTGPSPAPGREPTAQADPLAVLAEVLDRTASTTTATEAMREAQAFATNSGHLLTMWSAAVRAEAYAAVDKAVQERLTPAEWARYQAEPHRPVFQRLVLGAVLAGADLGAVVDKATRGDFTAARSLSAVMHGRLEAAGYRMGQATPQATEREAASSSAPGQQPVDAPATAQPRREPLTWAARVPQVIRPKARQVGRELGEALDARGRELAGAQADRPEPWVLETLGAFPAEGSPALQADWLARVGQAAVYREAAGITNPRQVLGPVPEGHPVLAAAHAEAVRLLELRTPDQFVWAIPRAELEATVAAYERVRATAPREVSAELRAERLAEADARARALELHAQGQAELAAQAEARADAGARRAVELEGAAVVYASWEESTAPRRAAAELAQAELNRRETTRPRLPEREAELAAGEPTPPAEPEGQQAEAAGLDAPEADREDLDVEATAGDLEAAVDQLPELDTTTVSPATEARTAELADRKAAQAEADTDEAQRKANREAYTAAALAAPGPEARSAWVQGLATPQWGGPQARTPEAEAELEAGL
jgi:hypothetical protein